MRACLLIMMGIVVGAGCAAGPQTRRNAFGNPASPTRSAGVGRAKELTSTVTPPSDANSPGESALDELEAELTQKQKQVSVPDPLEPVNRFMFGVNDVVYFWVLKPVLRGYVYAVSPEARTGLRNFFHNLATPARLVNCILQGKNAAADVELQRFAINTVVGALGLGDPARDRWELKPAEEDLGQTLAVYGLGDGFYLVWPLLGPSTLRDSVGMLGDAFLDPVRYLQPETLSIGVSATDTTNSMSFRLGEYESLKAATVDPYIAMRDAYLQYRKRQIQNEGGSADPNSLRP
ncbi:MAG: VacJ family lipoprotein [Planctomycetes bacterium]|nr:VacJ family lipoprotein [Planctomycetota bacterium]